MLNSGSSMKKLLKLLLYGFGGFIALGVVASMCNGKKELTEEQKVQMTLDSIKAAQITGQQTIEQARKDSIAAAMAPKPEATLKPETTVQNPTGLGVSLEQALAKFSEIEGVKITDAPLSDGTKRTMAQFNSFILECIGEPKNLSKISLTLLNDGNKQTANFNVVVLIRFFKNVLNTEDVDTFTDAIKNNKSSFVAGGRLVNVSRNKIDQIDAITLTIE